jgi:hypothetical protein
VTNGNLPVREQLVTELLFEQVVTVEIEGAPPRVDAKGAKQIRIYVNTSPESCPFIDIYAFEEPPFRSTTGYRLTRFIPDCGVTTTQVFDIPGRTLVLVAGGPVGSSAMVAIYGRGN